MNKKAKISLITFPLIAATASAIGFGVSSSITKNENVIVQDNKNNISQKEVSLNIEKKYVIEFTYSNIVTFTCDSNYSGPEISFWTSVSYDDSLNQKKYTSNWVTNKYNDYTPSEIINNWDLYSQDIISNIWSGVNDSYNGRHPLINYDTYKNKKIPSRKHIKILKRDLYTNTDKPRLLGIKKIYLDTGFIQGEDVFTNKYIELDLTRFMNTSNKILDFGISGFSLNSKNIIDTYYPEWNSNSNVILTKNKKSESSFKINTFNASSIESNLVLQTWRYKPTSPYDATYPSDLINSWIPSSPSNSDNASKVILDNLYLNNNLDLLTYNSSKIDKKYIKIFEEDLYARDSDGVILVKRIYIDSGFVNNSLPTNKYYIIDFTKQIENNNVINQSQENFFGISGFRSRPWTPPTKLENIMANSSISSYYVIDAIQEFTQTSNKGTIIKKIEEFILDNHEAIIKNYPTTITDNENNYQFSIVDVKRGISANSLKVSLKLMDCIRVNQTRGPEVLEFEITGFKWMPFINEIIIDPSSQLFVNLFGNTKGFFIDLARDASQLKNIENAFNQFFFDHESIFITGDSNYINITTPFKAVVSEHTDDAIVELQVSYSTTDGTKEFNYNDVKPIKIKFKKTPRTIQGLFDDVRNNFRNSDNYTMDQLKNDIVNNLNNNLSQTQKDIPDLFIPHNNKYNLSDIKLDENLITIDKNFINIQDNAIKISLNHYDMDLDGTYIDKASSEITNVTKSNWWIYIVVGSVGIVLVLLVVILFFVFRHKHRPRKKDIYYY